MKSAVTARYTEAGPRLIFTVAKPLFRRHDAVDWIGGYPYEVATREKLIDFFKVKGFEVLKVKRPDYTLGCNELVFTRHGK